MMPRSANRRVTPGRKPRARARKAKSSGAKGRSRGTRTATTPSRRRDRGGRRGAQAAEAIREERMTRLRGAAIVLALVFINGLVFFRSGDGAELLQLPASVGGSASLSGTALPMVTSCDGRGTRVFDNLDGQLHRSTRLTRGRTLRLGLMDAGVRSDSIDELEAAIRSTIDLGLLSGHGAFVRLAMDRSGAIDALELEISEGHVIQVCREVGDLRVRTLQHPLRTDVEVIRLAIPRSGSLFEAVAEAGERGELARRVGLLLAHEVDFAVESQPGDVVSVIVEKRYLGHDFHRYGPILAVRYSGARGRKAFYLASSDTTAPRYFDRKGEPMARAILRSPLATHPYDPDRRGTMAPTIEFVDGRIGLVYQRERGAPIAALGDGEVTFVGRLPDEGLVLEIALDDRRRYRYAHLDRVFGDLVVGAKVEQGQLVGAVGHTGQARTDRLRLEFLQDGVLVDPSVTASGEEMWAAHRGGRLAGDALAQFRTDTRGWRKILTRS